MGRPSSIGLGGLLLLIVLGACGDSGGPSRSAVKGSALDRRPPSVRSQELRPLTDPGYLHYTLRGPAPIRRRWRVGIDGAEGPLPESRLREETTKAVRVWNEALAQIADAPRLALVAFGEEADLIVGWDEATKETSSLFHPVHEALARTAALGEESWIRLDGGLAWEQPEQPKLLPVLVHELGHVFGLDHSLDERAVMCASYDPRRDQLTDSDFAGLAAALGKPWPQGRSGESLRLIETRVAPPSDEQAGAKASKDSRGQTWLLPGALRGEVAAALVDFDRDGRPEVLLRHVGKQGDEHWTVHVPGGRGWTRSRGPVRPPLELGERGLIDLDADGRLFALRIGAEGRYARLRFGPDALWGGVARAAPFRLHSGLADADGDGRLDEPGRVATTPWPPRVPGGQGIVLPEERGRNMPRFILRQE